MQRKSFGCNEAVGAVRQGKEDVSEIDETELNVWGARYLIQANSFQNVL